jgi:hypothetical protein
MVPSKFWVALVAAAVLWSSQASANEPTYADLVRVEELGGKFEATADPSFMYTASVRCASAYAVMGGLMETSGKAEAGKKYQDYALELVQRSVMFATMKWDHEPTEQENAEQIDRAVRGVQDYMKILADHIERNYKTTGEHFGNDTAFKSDMLYCKKVYNLDFAMLKSEEITGPPGG